MRPTRASFTRLGVQLCAAVAILLTLSGCTAVESRFERAREFVAQMKVQDAVDRYKSDHGAAPLVLSMLVPDYLPELPAPFERSASLSYDAADGRVTLGDPVQRVDTGEIPPMIGQDDVNLDRIADALGSYKAMYGRFPDNLGSLVPQFMDAVPGIAVTNEPYLYYPESGEVYHPAEMIALSEEEALAPATSQSEDPLRQTIRGNSMPTPEQVLDAGEQVFGQYEEIMEDLNL